MSKYVRISTPGVAAVEAFTVLGASSARSNADAIGQFGSGAKHAALCALRAELELVVCCGKTRVIPFTEKQVIHGVNQERVCFRVGTKTEVSSMTLDFGSLDWTAPVPMMLRELISNALDAVEGNWSKVRIEYVDSIRAKEGHTTIYVEVNTEVESYVRNLDSHFLHVSGRQIETCIPHDEPTTCRFYRKGVFVHSVFESMSLFDYNCGDDLPIDESRNLDSYRVACHAAQLLSRDDSAIAAVLRRIETGRTCYEMDFAEWYLRGSALAKVALEIWGEDVCVTDNPVTFTRAQSKGLNVKLIREANGWYASLKNGGIEAATKLLGRAESEGLSTFDPSDLLLTHCLQVWDCMTELKLCGSVEMPNVMEFEKPCSSGEQLGGFYDPTMHTIYVHREHVGRYATIIEEFAHAVTGANDETRDFQDYAFRMAGLLLERQLKGGN